MTIRPSWNDYFLAIAKVVSRRSTCPRAHVGAVIVSHDNRILATGYNGSPLGEPHCDDIGCLIVDNHC
ncbi:MAG: dCMP deaminase, partial [Proteobacteria bacterium]|nr:dCMP deaminase [Pseudomonadota bacterium]